MGYSGIWKMKFTATSPTSAIGNVPDPSHHNTDPTGPTNPYWKQQTPTPTLPTEVIDEQVFALDRAPGGPVQSAGAVTGGMSDPTARDRVWDRGSWRHQIDPGTVLARQWIPTAHREGELLTTWEPQDGAATVDSPGTLELQRWDRLPRRIGKRVRRVFHGRRDTHNWVDAHNPHLAQYATTAKNAAPVATGPYASPSPRLYNPNNITFVAPQIRQVPPNWSESYAQTGAMTSSGDYAWGM